MSDDNYNHFARIDLVNTIEAFSAVNNDGKVGCRNGCHELKEATIESMQAAARLPKCDECGSMLVVKWSVGDE